MRKKRTYISLLAVSLLSLYGMSAQDTLSHERHIVRSVMIGAGKSNIFDTYLSPLEYRGSGIRFMHESMRMTRLMSGNVSSQRTIQVYGSSAKNISKTAKSYSGMVSLTYALHYRHTAGRNLKLLFGPALDLNGGFVYNTRNSNNPAQAKAYGSIGASAMAIYSLRVAGRPLTMRYQVCLPLMGVMFSPEYGQSYYEMFSLKNRGRNVLFTSLHNTPSLRQMLTIDFPVGRAMMRVGYLCDIQQSRVNNLKSHLYSHDFMIGFVRNFRMTGWKERTGIPSEKTPL